MEVLMYRHSVLLYESLDKTDSPETRPYADKSLHCNIGDWELPRYGDSAEGARRHDRRDRRIDRRRFVERRFGADRTRKHHHTDATAAAQRHTHGDPFALAGAALSDADAAR